MINNDLATTRDNKVSSKVYAKRINPGSPQDYALYRHIRARFLQQSALYLGADLSDSKVLSLCFNDTPVCSE